MTKATSNKNTFPQPFSVYFLAVFPPTRIMVIDEFEPAAQLNAGT